MTTKYTPNFGLALPDFRMGPWHDLINNDLIKIDQLIFGALSQANIDAWQNATPYQIGTTVLDATDATSWMCVIAHTSPAAPTTFAAYRTANPTHWTRLLSGFAPRGEWQQAVNYFPYDLAYDSARGIMALCTVKHMSTPIGSIVDDKANWAFLLDMTDVGIVIASAVTYSNGASGIPKTNVQEAIDYIEVQVKAIDTINIAQGTRLTNLEASELNQQEQLNNLHNGHAAQQESINYLGGVASNHDARIGALEAAGSFPSGTKMLFFQANPPAGWNWEHNWHDRAIRIVGADGSGGTMGGIHGFSAIFTTRATDGHAITIAQMPAHDHTDPNQTNGPAGNGGFPATAGYSITQIPAANTGSAGGGQVHSHGLEMRVAYVNAIVAIKA